MGTVLRPVVMRSDLEGHRPATSLELLFDLCFVVAVAALAGQLHHDLAHGHVLDGALTYALLFVPIWWAWMSYSWFATACDNDDVGFRLLTGAQMLGVLAVAAAIPAAAQGDFGPFTIAYTLMRLPLVVQWLRAAHDDPAHRRFALRYAAGTLAAQALWLAGLRAEGLTRNRRAAFTWGYGHYVLFASLAAIGGGHPGTDRAAHRR